MTNETASQRLARWIVALRYEDLTPNALFHAKRCVLDTLGVQLRGSTLPWVQPVYAYARAIGGNDAATITYYGERVHAPYAAYVNSAFSYSCELQHHGSPESAHVGVIVVPVVQALGELLGASGKDMITAMVAGYEAQGRLGAAIYQPEFPRHHNSKERHFHLQGMMAVFGATAAAGKLLGLNEDQQAHAFGIAGSHASGLLEYDEAGGEVKRIHGAIGARSGMQAAMLAKAGLTGPATVFEGRHGYFAAFGGAKPSRPETLFTEFANPYCITRCRYRIYPTIGTCHSPIDIIGDLLKQHPFHHTDVQSVRVGLYERGLMHVGSIKRPHDVISAQASLAYSVGAKLVKGSNNLEMYLNPELWRDPEILAIADKVEGYAVAKPDLPRYTHVEIKLKNGKVLAGEALHTRGSEKVPFSDEIMADKFRTLAQVVLPRERVEAIMQTVNRLETLGSVAELVPLLRK
jgi:2-methylcitrate dehydratase PrpD